MRDIFFLSMHFFNVVMAIQQKGKKNRCSYWDQSQLFLFSILFFNCHLASSCFYLTLFYSDNPRCFLLQAVATHSHRALFCASVH